MTLAELHTKLVAAYTAPHLAAITAKIIALHRSRQTPALEKIATAVNNGSKDASSPGKLFSSLMMTYHPDRLALYRSAIDEAFTAKDRPRLESFAHIFTAIELEKTLVVLSAPRPSRNEPDDYRWEQAEEVYEEYDDDEDGSGGEQDEEPMDEYDPAFHRRRTFYSVFKQNIYGTKNIELPFHYLEELDALDVSGFDIEDLDGIGHCVNLLALDLSHNRLLDISDLTSLTHLRELYLTNNRIGYIDALAYCPDLRVLDLSDNDVDDITPLFDLDNLEYVNLSGNRIPANQISALKKRGVLVL